MSQPARPSWARRHRLPIQIGALLLAILAPFGLFAALQGGNDMLAGGCFAIFALAMLLTVWVG
jgi:hypothetical protein